MENIIKLDDIDISTIDIANLNMLVSLDNINNNIHEALVSKISNKWNLANTCFENYALCINVINNEVRCSILGQINQIDDISVEDAVAVPIDIHGIDNLVRAIIIYHISRLFLYI